MDLTYLQYNEKQIQFRTTKSKRSVERDALSRRFQCCQGTTFSFFHKEDSPYLNGAVEETVVLTGPIEQSFRAGEAGIMIVGR